MTRTYVKRPAASGASRTKTNGSPVDVAGIVKGVIDTVRQQGDGAVRRYSEQFDKWSPVSFELSKEDIEQVIAELPEQVIQDIKTVQANVRKFAEAQKDSLKEFELEMAPGVLLGQKNNPIDSVGA